MFYVWDRHGNFQGALGGKECPTEQQAIARARELGTPAPMVQDATQFKQQHPHHRAEQRQQLEYLA